MRQSLLWSIYGIYKMLDLFIGFTGCRITLLHFYTWFVYIWVRFLPYYFSKFCIQQTAREAMVHAEKVHNRSATNSLPKNIVCDVVARYRNKFVPLSANEKTYIHIQQGVLKSRIFEVQKTHFLKIVTKPVCVFSFKNFHAGTPYTRFNKS